MASINSKNQFFRLFRWPGNDPVYILLLSIVVLLNACSRTPSNLGDTAAEPLSMTFMAGYKPQANLPFVGVYVAQEEGYFGDENLNVAIEHSPGRGEHLQLLTAGKIQVTTQDVAVLLQRRADPGLPLVSIALLGQRGQQAYAALSSTNLLTPKDWEEHIVGYKGTPPPDLFALINASGADVDKIQLVNVGFDPRVLTEGQVDVYPVYKSNEPYLLESWGFEITLWDADDYGVPTLGLAYVTSEEILANEPEMLTRFLRATLKGIDFAILNPDQAIDHVLKYTGPETNRNHMLFMLQSEILDAQSEITAEFGLGWHAQEQWQALADLLRTYEAMLPIDVSLAFTNRILEAAAESD
jgi:ABC-type nitrate/sulfonate/bicarbonate transport system substrate-binding protein